MMTREEYCLKHSSLPSKARKDLADFTRKNVPRANMLIGELEGAFFQFLVKSSAMKNIIELGTYTGYSALTFAEALPSDGKVLTLDINPETTATAQTYWDQSPHGKKIEAYVGDSAKKLAELVEKKVQFDAMFVDADKENYPNYVNASKLLLKKGGVLIIDNVLWDDKVLGDNAEASTLAIKKASDMVLNDTASFECVMLPVRDGVMLARLL